MRVLALASMDAVVLVTRSLLEEIDAHRQQIRDVERSSSSVVVRHHARSRMSVLIVPQQVLLA